MKRVAAAAVLLLAGFGAGWYFNKPGAQPAEGERKILYWHDPMHPWFKSDKPGIAPDCNMPLEPVYADGGTTHAPSERQVLYYHDPEAPSYRSDKPGLNPETGNDLVPVHAGDAPGSVRISAEKQQLIGVKLATAELTSPDRSVRAVGRVAIDETRIVRVHPRLDGWVERVFVDYTGQSVKAGQPLLTLYSPEMLASQQEYLLALRGAQILKDSTVPDSLRNAAALIDASRRRLELFDLSEAQVEQVAATGKPIRDIIMHAPASGYVMARNVFPKQRVTPETELYQIADLSRIWIMADVFESDASAVRTGIRATISQPYGGRTFTATVAHILPTVDPQTRTMRVRLEAPNADMRLKPDMYVDVDFRMGGAPQLTVPAEAVINTGTRQVVYVAAGDGAFEPRKVKLGNVAAGRAVILEGLAPGDRVVTQGNFLIDSESQLQHD